MNFGDKCKKMSLDELEDLQTDYEAKLETIYYWIEIKSEEDE